MKGRSAVIIGGGIAGLAAALELQKNDISTTVLEAKNRFGGRIHTIHHNGIPIELGAEFVHGRSKPLLKALRNAKLSLQTVPDAHRTFEDGKLYESKIWDIISDVFKRVDVRKPDCSIEAFLAREPLDERTRDLVRNFVTGFDAAHADRISAHACRRAEYSGEQMGMDQQTRVGQGYSALVDYFVHEIQAHGGRLIVGTKVKRVRWEEGRVEVVARKGRRNQIFRADAAIVTLPVGVLKAGHVVFEPTLPHKIEAANGLEFGNVVKVIFQFRESLWNDFGFIHVPGAPIPTWWSDGRGPILTGWAGGPTADALLELSTKRLWATGLEILSKILFNGEPVRVLRHGLLAVHYCNWAGDSKIRGAYSYIPVNGLDLPKLLAAPVGDTLFFAGEATVTDAQSGTVFGALETGQRAAREFLSAA
ncbi:MAG TPA: NAD(P)/FAD-dependent oxidoreductase [Candidatus Acidoferrales bacterium]|jgi:monoamine oxidase|nr:NAD(P)/FAD-dependent oxidoreductase [Candidatus Acidoferrales bacterium]